MTEVGCYPGWGRVSFTVNDHYFRAVAKMAFHYYLCYNGSGVGGDEPEFADLRRFILEGGELEPFFTTPRESSVYFGVPFGKVVGGGVLSSGRWCHLLGADVYLQLFIGPGYANPPHYIKLGPAPAALRAPGAWAHMLSWEPASTRKGIVEPKRIIRGGRPETIVGPWLDTSDGANALYTAYRTSGIVSDYRQVSG